MICLPLNGQIMPHPVPKVLGAKIYNTLPYAINFQYRFEDDFWRSSNIAPHRAVYIYDSDPKYDLVVKYEANGSLIHNKLETRFFEVEQRNARGEPRIDLERNDQAEPYNFARSSQGDLVLYAGFPSHWIEEIAAKVRDKLAANQADLSILKTAIRPDTTDVFLEEIEFRSIADVIETEYSKRLRSKVPPEIAIQWVKPENYLGEFYFPRLKISGCCYTQEEEFLKRIIEQVLGESPDWFEVVVDCKCAAMAFVEQARLNPRYVRNHRIRLETINRDLMRHLNTGQLAAAHYHDRSPNSRRICTQWQIKRRNNSHYRWKLVIDITAIPSGDSPGIELTTNIVTQKRIGVSDNWKALSQFAVFDLGGGFVETMTSIDNAPEELPNKILDSQKSPVVQLCLNTSKDLAKILSP